eukprot:6198161-Pleurochrysis_carterae.AAC.10
MEGSTRGGEVCGLLTSSAKTPLLEGRAARPGSKRAGGVEYTMGGRTAGARERRCAEPALMQERELQKGSVRRCGAEGRRSHWPSITGADPAASSGVPPGTTPNCKPVRGRNTGVSESVRGEGLSASLPPCTQAAKRRAVQCGRGHQRLCASHASSLACEWRAWPRRGRGRAAAGHSRRVGECGLRSLALSSIGSGVAAPLVSRVPPAKGAGPRSSTCAWGNRTGA